MILLFTVIEIRKQLGKPTVKVDGFGEKHGYRITNTQNYRQILLFLRKLDLLGIQRATNENIAVDD